MANNNRWVDTVLNDQIGAQLAIVRELSYKARNTRGASCVDAFAALACAQIGLAALIQAAYARPVDAAVGEDAQ
jgi:hypothetical protein